MKTIVKYLLIGYVILTAIIYFDVITKKDIPESTGKVGIVVYDVAAFGAKVTKVVIKNFNDKG